MKVKSTLFNSLRGRLGDRIQSQTYNGQKILRKFTPPRNPGSNPQTSQRALYTGIDGIYQALIAINPGVRSAWDEKATDKRISGYNDYMEHGMKNEVWLTLESYTPPTWILRFHYSCRLDALDTVALFSIDASSWIPLPGLNPVVIGEDVFMDFPGSGSVTVYFTLGSLEVYNKVTPTSYLNSIHSFYKKNPAAGTAVPAIILIP